jgi:hypothetical protein
MYEAGHEVRHKSNRDLPMVVVSSDEKETTCEWLDSSGKRHQDTFLTATLEPKPERQRTVHQGESSWVRARRGY